MTVAVVAADTAAGDTVVVDVDAFGNRRLLG